MALVCDIESNNPQEESPDKQQEIDLEDGEIEDDEDESAVLPPPEAPKPEEPPPPVPPFAEKPKPFEKEKEKEKPDKDKDRIREKDRDRRKHEEKGKRHMTEAEKSILHLRKREEAQRKKWEKMNRLRDVEVMDDDFAKNIEKTLATILSKKEKEAAAAAAAVAAASGSGDDRERERDKEKECHKEDREKLDEDLRGRKRRKNNHRNKKNKQRRLECPQFGGFDELEPMNMTGLGPDHREGSPRRTPSDRSEESYESGDSAGRMEERSRRRDIKKEDRRNREHGKNKHKNRDRDKQKLEQDSHGVCIFYLQGKCQKTDCPYSHEAVPPMKLELCKFYLMGCCAKGDKCSYMHSEFPCKFYHTGLSCLQGDDCKFAHGKPLSDNLKQILFKHIETAPRDILGGFPRVSREEALQMIDTTQAQLLEQHGLSPENKDLESKGGIPSLFDINVPVPPELLQGNDGKGRHKPSRWQDTEQLKPFNYGQDQDMRYNSNGDIDMRTLPPPVSKLPPNMLPPPIAQTQDLDLEQYKREARMSGSPQKDFDISHPTMHYPLTKDVDIRTTPFLASRDVDSRQIPGNFNELEEEPRLQIDTGDDMREPAGKGGLFIDEQQKEETNREEDKDFQMENINWYSDDDDDDDNRLTIKVENDEKEDQPEGMDTSESVNSQLPAPIKPQEVVEKLGDLSKIDISAEVTKLLNSMSQNRMPFPFVPKESNDTPTTAPVAPTTPPLSSDPKTFRQDPRMFQDKPEPQRADPRLTSEPRTSIDPRASSDPRLSGLPRQRSRQSSSESQHRPEKISIYEQGSIDRNAQVEDTDIDIRSMRSDVDLRNLQLPFKGMQNYTPASEIDASINSHPPISWKIVNVEVPRPDYTGLKLSISDAEKTGDPRLRKIFRLSTEERDTPLSPKASPKAHTSVRVDPRLRKMEESKTIEGPVGIMNFNQQVTALQSSAFYQSLTSNQKLLLNQELSQLRNDSNNSHDPILNSLLSNLKIIPSQNMAKNPSLGAALNILANVSKLNPMINPSQPVMGQMGQNVNPQPGLLGAAPGIPNLPPDFPMNFNPRNGGLLGNAPMPFGGYSPQDSGNFNMCDDFYPMEGGGNFQGNHRENRGFNRDRRRGRNNYNRGGGNRNFRNRNHRPNRNHSPP